MALIWFSLFVAAKDPPEDASGANWSSFGLSLTASWNSVSPLPRLTVICLSSPPRASRPSGLHAPHVMPLVCLPIMLMVLPILLSYRRRLPLAVPTLRTLPWGSHAT